MFKSIFSKYFAVISAIIVFSFLAMQGAQLFLSSRYWLDEKHRLLADNAQTIATHTADGVSPVRGSDGMTVYRIEKSTLSPFIKLLSMTMDCTVVISDMDGTVLIMCDENGDEMSTEGVVSLAGAFDADGTEFYAVSTLNGLYKDRQYTAGVPIRHDGKLLGYVFVSLPASGLGQYLRSNIQISLLAALGVLTLTFVALYIMTEHMVRPLREMAQATRKFAEGDFSYQIKVSGRDETAELAHALNSMARSLSSVETMRRSFVANVSHELRTPMTTIKGFIDGMLDGTIPQEETKHYLGIVSQETGRLARLVQNMLDITKLEAGEVPIHAQTYDLWKTVTDVVLSDEQRIEDGKIDIQGLGGDPLPIYADPDFVHQVVYNIVDNAIKFTPAGGAISFAAEKHGSMVEVRIENTGAGIAPEALPFVFERFYKEDRSRGMNTRGSGLGLHICKILINLSGGQIHAESEEGKWCRFVFTLPAGQ